MGDKKEHMLSLLFQEFINSEDSRALFIGISDEGQLLQNSSISEVVSHVNTCLNTGHRRKEGAQLLCGVLRQCSSEVFQQHAETWAKLLLQALQSYDDIKVQEATCKATEHLLRASTAFPELVRSFSVNIIPYLVGHLLTFPDEWRNLTLRMLITCMSTYPGPCGNGGLRLKIEQAVLRRFLDSDLACKAYSYLPQCGGAGNQSIKHTTAWSTSFSKLLTSVLDCLDELYGFVEVSSDRPNADSNPLVFPELPETEPARTIMLSKRMKALCTAITHMLRPNFPAPVQIDLNTVLQMICRVMAISPDFLLTRPTQDRIRLAGFIPSLHIAALQVLDALVKFAGTAMMPYASSVNQMYSQAFVWIRKLQPVAKYGSSSSYAGIEKALWRSISTWLETLGGSSGVDDIADDLVKAFVHIVTPVQDTVTSDPSSSKLAEVSGMFHGKKGKGKKRIQNAQEQLSSQRKLNYTADWELVTSAWQAASLIIRKVGAFMAPSCYQAIHNVVFTVLKPVQPAIPYHHPKCLSAVYSTLLACITCPHPSWPAPVQIATELFSHHKHNPVIQRQCAEGLLVCENIIHPRAPCLSQPLDIDELTENKAQKKVSEHPEQLYFIPPLASESVKVPGVNTEIESEHSDAKSDPSEVEYSDDSEEEETEDHSAIPTSSKIDSEQAGDVSESMETSKNVDEEEMENKDSENTNGDAENTSNNIVAANHKATSKEEAVVNPIVKRKLDPEVEEEKSVKLAKYEKEAEDTTEIDLMLSTFNPE